MGWGVSVVSKGVLRGVMGERRGELSVGDVAVAGEGFLRQLEASRWAVGVWRVGLFCPVGGETDVLSWWPVLRRRGSVVGFPRARGGCLSFHAVEGLGQLERGPWGVAEPVGKLPVLEVDLVLTPLLAVDVRGNRLGRGGGFYDRYFARWGKVYRLGVAYTFQVVEAVPCEAHDQRLHAWVTQDGYFSAS